MTAVVGIDPGLTGAVGILDNGNFVQVEDIPTTLKGSGVVKNEVDPHGLYKMIRYLTLGFDEAEIALERVSAMPGQGSSSVFSFGDTYGCCRTAATVSGYPVFLVPPSVWKKHFKLGRDKEEARALAIRLFPDAPLNLKKHADRAESLLIARWLWETRHS